MGQWAAGPLAQAAPNKTVLHNWRDLTLQKKWYRWIEHNLPCPTHYLLLSGLGFEMAETKESQSSDSEIEDVEMDPIPEEERESKARRGPATPQPLEVVLQKLDEIFAQKTAISAEAK